MIENYLLSYEDTQHVHKIMCLVTEFQKTNCESILKEIEDRLILNQSIQNMAIEERSFKYFWIFLKKILKRHLSINYSEIDKNRQKDDESFWWYLHNPTPHIQDIDKQKKEILNNQ